jgi:hypothetical protein
MGEELTHHGKWGNRVGGRVVHDAPFGLDQKRRKSLEHGHRSLEVELKQPLALLDLDIQARRNEVPTAVVDQDIESPPRFPGA